MIYNLKSQGTTTYVNLKGRLTFADYATFREITTFCNINMVRLCRFDLSKLEFIDSAGLGMLLIVSEKMANRNGQLVLQGATGQVRKMLDLGRLDQLVGME